MKHGAVSLRQLSFLLENEVNASTTYRTLELCLGIAVTEDVGQRSLMLASIATGIDSLGLEAIEPRRALLCLIRSSSRGSCHRSGYTLAAL